MISWRAIDFALLLFTSFAFALPPSPFPTSVPRWDTQSSRNRIDLKQCQLPNVDGSALCGVYDVYENRAAKSGRKISLNIVILPALGPSHLPDPVFWLHGGPGAAATGAVGIAKGGFLEVLRNDRDLVFIDQRGTGKITLKTYSKGWRVWKARTRLQSRCAGASPKTPADNVCCPDTRAGGGHLGDKKRDKWGCRKAVNRR
jgi:pimeloyl-ACP methyl ester carboxylesterase